MLTDFLEIIKFHKVFAPSDEQRPSVVRLSDILDKKIQVEDLHLPPLCEHIYRKGKGDRCRKVCRFVSEIVRQQRRAFPFAFCCWAGAKVLAIPHGKEVYLLFCRSPFLHESPLKSVAENCKLDLTYVKDLSDLLPRFGLRVVRLGLQMLAEQKKVEISGQVRTGLINIAKAYGQYEFDMIIYDTMRAIPSQDGYDQVVVMSFVSRPKKVPVVRIVFNESGPNTEDWGIPIIGMAVETKRRSELADCLRGEAVQGILNVIEKALKKRDLKPIGKIEDPDRERRERDWVIDGGIYAKDGQETHRNQAESINEFVVRGVEAGSGAFYASLVSALDEKFDTFLMKLSSYAARFKDTFDGCDEEDKPGKEQNLHCRALGDIEAGLAHFLQKDVLRPNTVKQVIEELLSFLKDYPLWLPAPGGQRAEKRRDCLFNDMLRNRRNYLNSLKYEIAVLEGQLYEKSASERRKIAWSIWADFFAVLSKWLTLGMVYSCDVGADIRRRAHHRYVKDKLPLAD